MNNYLLIYFDFLNMPNIKKKYKLRVNSLEKIEELLQEIYDEADKTIVEVQNQLNKLTSSIDLNNEIADAKAKLAKAINDYINTKHKALNHKEEIAKLLIEIHKYNGNISAVNASGVFEAGDWETLKSMMNEESVTEEKEEYKLNYK